MRRLWNKYTLFAVMIVIAASGLGASIASVVLGRWWSLVWAIANAIFLLLWIGEWVEQRAKDAREKRWREWFPPTTST